jgi:hypothetical protein
MARSRDALTPVVLAAESRPTIALSLNPVRALRRLTWSLGADLAAQVGVDRGAVRIAEIALPDGAMRRLRPLNGWLTAPPPLDPGYPTMVPVAPALPELLVRQANFPSAVDARAACRGRLEAESQPMQTATSWLYRPFMRRR